MIQPQTLLILADNSGARKLVCIRVIGAASNQDMLFKGNFSQITYMRKIARYRYEMDPEGPP
jgi:ribosomal protein L14